MVKTKNVEAMKTKLELLEKEFARNSDKKGAVVKKTYLHLLKRCGKNCGLADPMYIDRVQKNGLEKFVRGEAIGRRN